MKQSFAVVTNERLKTSSIYSVPSQMLGSSVCRGEGVATGEPVALAVAVFKGLSTAVPQLPSSIGP
jgi:hypothetical protein